MGIIITKFRKKKTTYEILEKLETEIQSIEEFRRSTEQTQKKMVGRFIFISICVYCITALIFYFYFFPATAYERIIYIIPLIILPMLLILIKRILSWYYNRKIRKNQKKLSSLKDEKKKILEEVMDKETYKVAKTILEKFAPEQIKKTYSTAVSENTPVKTRPLTPMNPAVQSQTGIPLVHSQHYRYRDSHFNANYIESLRYRGQFSSTPNQPTLGTIATPRPRPSFGPSATPALLPKLQSQNLVPSVGPSAFSGTPLLLPRAVLPRERSVLDKMVDYLIGDGPSNRYALICRNCSSHNGMALKEEFDYLSFRCCYCSAFNPARKKRPVAPKLDPLLSIKSRQSDVSDSDRHSPSDTDSGSETGDPIITEPQSDSRDEHGPLIREKATSLSDSDKLSELDIKNSDTESAVEADTTTSSTEENTIRNGDTRSESHVESVTTEDTKEQD